MNPVHIKQIKTAQKESSKSQKAALSMVVVLVRIIQSIVRRDELTEYQTDFLDYICNVDMTVRRTNHALFVDLRSERTRLQNIHERERLKELQENGE